MRKKDEISPCPKCHSLTKTISGKCSKCKAKKVDRSEPPELQVEQKQKPYHGKKLELM